MKIIKGLTVLIITLTLGSCFDPPEFPSVPQIDFVSVKFKEGNATNRTDSLLLSISFKDGDGDLGLDPTAPEFNSAPFNNLTFYQTNDADKANLIPVNTVVQTIEHVTGNQRVAESFQVLQFENPALGKLVFPRTRKQSGYSYLPAYEECDAYEYFRAANYVVDVGHKDVLDQYATVDTLFNRIGPNKIATHYVIRDTLYFTVNKNHYNIDVDFYVKDPSHPKADNEGFVLFDWRREFCQQDLYGRFPFLTDKTGQPLEGTIRYGLTTIGFKRIFTIKTLKLRIRIRDRERNESNTIVTPEFTLDSIRI